MSLLSTASSPNLIIKLVNMCNIGAFRLNSSSRSVSCIFEALGVVDTGADTGACTGVGTVGGVAAGGAGGAGGGLSNNAPSPCGRLEFDDIEEEERADA